jgi:hypothetical protein
MQQPVYRTEQANLKSQGEGAFQGLTRTKEEAAITAHYCRTRRDGGIGSNALQSSGTSHQRKASSCFSEHRDILTKVLQQQRKHRNLQSTNIVKFHRHDR